MTRDLLALGQMLGMADRQPGGTDWSHPHPTFLKRLRREKSTSPSSPSDSPLSICREMGRQEGHDQAGHVRAKHAVLRLQLEAHGGSFHACTPPLPAARTAEVPSESGCELSSAVLPALRAALPGSSPRASATSATGARASLVGLLARASPAAPPDRPRVCVAPPPAVYETWQVNKRDREAAVTGGSPVLQCTCGTQAGCCPSPTCSCNRVCPSGAASRHGALAAQPALHHLALCSKLLLVHL